MNPLSNEFRLPARPLVELQPLAHFQRQARQRAGQPPPGQPQPYTIVLAEDAPLRLYFISPGQLAGAPPSSHLAGTVLQFTDGFVCQEADIRDVALTASLFYRAAEDAPLPISGPDANSLVFLVNALKQELNAPGLRKEALVRTYLKAFLLHCLRLREEQAPMPPPGAAGSLFLRFRSMLEERYTVLKTVAEYANLLHVSANHLSETIKKETGRTAGGHIRYRIVAEAQRLADCSGLTLKEIAYQLGYDDVAHFSRLFKRCVGVNFSQYKGQLAA
ncbi:helix-turn-helix domain-containing protein [Hymenobacter ruricola]|uniref:AraC family transcriptional regulator n=1 Tax=Hymenobacter ruricola TaxID=2791023 RepID=A0ABS0I2Z2_9BACT|nr:helix-turn-helix domain-containing protein [Hymenobacter ruricola]MBF9221284.1 AraC family transcriptional regulator [Hymenobacter ruricola]